MAERTCVECGETFTPTHGRQTICSKACRNRRGRRQYDPEKRREAKAREHQRHRERYPEQYTTEVLRDLRRRSDAKRRPAVLAARKVERARQARLRAARQRLRRAKAGTRSRRTWLAGRCTRCGASFVSRYSAIAAGYCSKVCQRSDLRDRRRARQAGVKLTPGRRHAVFERDDWTCQICGDPVNRDAQVPDLDAPTVDHTIPLVAGGEHGPDNWQTAHFYCNSVKGASQAA